MTTSIPTQFGDIPPRRSPQPAATVQTSAHPAPAAKDPVFCKDCRHFISKSRITPPKCAAPGTQTLDLVFGPLMKACWDVRHAADLCGIDARLFDARTPDGVGDFTHPGSSPLATFNREPYSGLSTAPSASNRSSLSRINRASVDNSTITVATASDEVPGPNTD